MSCLRRLTHIVEYDIILRNFEIEVYLHSSVMCVAWHRVPYAARLKCGHTHLKLTALNLSRKNILADSSVVSILKTAKLLLILRKDILLRVNEYSRISLMCRSTVKVKLSRKK